MTRIVHLTASTFFGGPERQMLGLAAWLRPGIETTFASFSEGGRCAAFLRKARDEEHPAVELARDTPHFRETIRDIEKLITPADVLFVHGYKAGLLGRIAARRAGIPVVGVSRGWTAENWKVRVYERLDRWNLKRLDHVVCVSNGQGAKVRRAGVSPAKMSVIHNSARLGDFSPRRSSGRNPLTILAAGRLSPEKGFQLLPAIAQRVFRLHSDVKFLMAGDGPLRDSIEKDAIDRGVAGGISFLGFRDDIDQLMARADVLLLPSYTEGLPNVVLEAAAAGIPCVATRVGGTPEAIQDGETGYLTPAGDVAAMAEALIELAGDEDRRRRMGEAARAHMEASFSFQSQAAGYRTLIEKLLAKPVTPEFQACG